MLRREISPNYLPTPSTRDAQPTLMGAHLWPHSVTQPSLSATVTNLRRERCMFAWRSSPRGPGCLVKRDRDRRRGAKPSSEPARPNLPTHQRSSRPLPPWAVDSLSQPSFQKPAEITMTLRLTATGKKTLTAHKALSASLPCLSLTIFTR